MESSSSCGDNIDIKEWRVQTLLTPEATTEPSLPGIQTKSMKTPPENEGLNVASTIIKEDLAENVKPESAEVLENTILTKKANKTIVTDKEIKEIGLPPLTNDEASKLTKDSTVMSSDDKEKKETASKKANDDVNLSLIDTTNVNAKNNKAETFNATTQTSDVAVNKSNKPIKPIDNNSFKEVKDSVEPGIQQICKKGLSPRSIGKYPLNIKKVTNVEELQSASLSLQQLLMDNINETATGNQHDVELESCKPAKPDVVKPAPNKATKEIPYYDKVRKMLAAHQSILQSITAREFDVYMANLVCNMKPNSKVPSKETTRMYISDFERAKKLETVPHQMYLESLWRKEQLKVKEPELKVPTRKIPGPVQCIRKKKDDSCWNTIRTFGYLITKSIDVLGLTNIIPKPDGIVY